MSNDRTPAGSSATTNVNSGSQYATCALGVGLVALGTVMIIWSVVPADTPGNSSKPGHGMLDSKGKTSTVAFILVASGVTMLLLSLCLGMRNKRRQGRLVQGGQGLQDARTPSEDGDDTNEERGHRYSVPTYEEAVGSGQYPIRQSGPRSASTSSTSQLPTYEDLVDGPQAEPGGPPQTSAPPPTGPMGPTDAPGRRNVWPGRKLLPLKIRRIKSEKLGRKNQGGPPPPAVFSIEPLTPPPQYDDKPPQL